MARRTVILGAIASLIIAGSAAAIVYEERIPAAWRPWAPLRIAEPPNWLTRYKLDRASADDDACLAALAQSDWDYTAVDDQTTAPGCGYRNAVRIGRMRAAVGDPFTLSCRAALSLAWWERHVLQPAAQRHFGAPVSEIEHFGSYSCRAVYGRPNARMSNHATADALDVSGFVIDGQRVRILSGWTDPGREGRFLREVHEGACDFFDSALGPAYNRAHRDHFHLDRGPFRACK